MSYRSGVAFDHGFAFQSQSTGADTLHPGQGYYEHAPGPDDFSPGATAFGTANNGYGAHVYVVLGALTVDQLTIRISGTSWNPATSILTPGDTEDIVIPNATAVDTYFQTAKYWVGQITLQAVVGTAQDCNYGFAVPWTNQDQQFFLHAICVSVFGDNDDAAADFLVRRHQLTGWTFNGGGAVTPPAAVASSAVDYGAEDNVSRLEPFLWCKLNTALQVDGHLLQGLIFEAVQGLASPFINGNVVYHVHASR